MNQEQMLLQQGWSIENINKLKMIASNPEAQEYALKTSDLDGAFQMCQPKEKSEVNLNEWFSSFVESQPEDAKSLSIAMTKFARFIQSSVDKKPS